MIKTTLNIFLFSIILFTACKKSDNTIDVFHSSRNNIIDVSSRIISLDLESKCKENIGRSFLYRTKDNIIVCDHQSPNKGIHLFELGSYNYIGTTGIMGKGPKEIIRLGSPSSVYASNDFYVSDLAKKKVFRFNLDSLTINPNYLPDYAFSIKGRKLPMKLTFIDDSTFIGKGLDFISNKDFNGATLKGKIDGRPFETLATPYEKVNSKNLSSYFCVSPENKRYIDVYGRYDLITINDLNGKVKKRIFGPEWEDKKTKKSYFYIVHSTDKYIMSAYSGEVKMKLDEFKRYQTVYAQKIMVFDYDGKYVATLDTKHDIIDFIVNQDNNHIICYFEDLKNPFAYIDLNGILDI